jgi:hypothetical protein
MEGNVHGAREAAHRTFALNLRWVGKDRIRSHRQTDHHAWGNLAEESEVKFWTSLVFGASSNAMHSEVTRNLFGLQRLITVLNDMDHSREAVDEELLKRTAAKPKPEVGALDALPRLRQKN